MKRKLIVLAAVLLLTAISVPTALMAGSGDPPPLCGTDPSSCQKPGVVLQIGK